MLNFAGAPENDTTISVRWCIFVEWEAEVYFEIALQTLGIAEIPLVDADFVVNPRKIVQLDTAFFKPEAHGHLLKLAKVRAYCSSGSVFVQGTNACMKGVGGVSQEMCGWMMQVDLHVLHAVHLW